MKIDMMEVHNTWCMKDEARHAAVRTLHDILKQAAFRLWYKWTERALECEMRWLFGDQIDDKGDTALSCNMHNIDAASAESDMAVVMSLSESCEELYQAHDD